MGCFNVSCALSGLPIGATDPIYILPIIGQVYDTSGIYCSNQGPSSLWFNLFALPFEAEYDDYGSFENVKLDYRTRVICEFFGIEETEENLIALFSMDRGESKPLKVEQNLEARSRLHFCYMLKEVYDQTAKHSAKILDVKKGDWYDYDKKATEFKKSVDDYRLLKKELERLGPDRHLIYSPYRNNRSFPAFETHLSSGVEYDGDLEADLKKVSAGNAGTEFSNEVSRKLSLTYGETHYPLSLYEDLDFKLVRKGIVDYFKVWAVMNSLNKILMPSSVIGQDRNYEEFAKFNSLVFDQYLKAQIKIQKDYENEDL